MTDFSAGQYVLAGIAAAGAGCVNAIAGGGTLISFPALVALGASNVSANVTNTVALCPGYFGGAYAQRAFLRELGGGCLLPIAALATMERGQIHLQGVVLSADGRQRLLAEGHGSTTACEAVGREIADELLGRGAAALLASHPQPSSGSTRAI